MKRGENEADCSCMVSGVGCCSSAEEEVATLSTIYSIYYDASLVQEMARGREEGRAARLYTVSLLLLAATWSPLYILATVQVDTLDISTYLNIYHNQCRRSPSRRPTLPRTCRRW